MRRLYMLALLAVLILALAAGSALAQEEDRTCEQAADNDGNPALQISQRGARSFLVSGCHFSAGETVTVEVRYKLGNGEW